MNSWVMRIKQQKAIRQFLIDELGEEKGGSLFEDQNKAYVCLNMFDKKINDYNEKSTG